VLLIKKKCVVVSISLFLLYKANKMVQEDCIENTCL